MGVIVDDQEPASACVARIRDEIARGRYLPRERLVEADLVEALGVSRGTVRTALVLLQAEGLIERLPHRGAVVRSLNLAEGIELADVRRELESLCARAAAESAGEADRKAIRVDIADMEEAAARGEALRYRAISAAFHERIIALSRHGVAARELAAVRRHDLRRHFPQAFANADLVDSLDEHREIGEAVIAGDAAWAAVAMSRHTGRIAELLRRSGLAGVA